MNKNEAFFAARSPDNSIPLQPSIMVFSAAHKHNRLLMPFASRASDAYPSGDAADSTRRGSKFEGFDFLRAFFSVVIIAYKTKIFYIPKFLVPSSLTIALSDYVLSGMVGAMAVPVFLQISLFLFQLKSQNMGLGYFLQKRLPRLISLYLFWVLSITLFDVLWVDGWAAIQDAIASPKRFLMFVVSGNSTPYFFFFSLLFVTVLSQLLILVFQRLKQPAARLRLSYALLIASSILVFALATIEPLIQYWGIQSSLLQALNNLTGWDYSPLNFLPYIFTAAITAQEYHLGKLAKMPPFLKRRLVSLTILTLGFFALEWILTSRQLLIQVDQAPPLAHYMRLSLVYGSWLFLYLGLQIKRTPPAWVALLSACSLGIYGFHVFFIFKKPLLFSTFPLLVTVFQPFPVLQSLVIFGVTLLSSIALTLLFKRVKILKRFV